MLSSLELGQQPPSDASLRPGTSRMDRKDVQVTSESSVDSTSFPYASWITKVNEDSAEGDYIEDLSESSADAMDTVLLAPTIECRQTSPDPSSGYRNLGHSPPSDFKSSASSRTASTPASFISARSTYNSSADMSASEYNTAMVLETIREDELPASGLSAPLVQLHNEYYTNLHQQNIIQPFDKELNWSGKGQHVTFASHDAIPLSSMSANVDKVLCRRLALARKTMRCNRKCTVADAVREVYHLQNLRHFHIVQLVGTYLQGRNFSILMYPVADTHLGRFLEDTLDADILSSVERTKFLASTLGCLASTVAFIHRRTTKHMDIKPQNILVRRVHTSTHNHRWRIYIADFGLSRSFTSQDHSQTDGPTSRTPRYCAPEVYNHEKRGRSADIFSLDCVFLEILTAIRGIDLHYFTDARRGDGDDESFHANLGRVVVWARKRLCVPSDYWWHRDCALLTQRMLRRLSNGSLV